MIQYRFEIITVLGLLMISVEQPQNGHLSAYSDTLCPQVEHTSHPALTSHSYLLSIS